MKNRSVLIVDDEENIRLALRCTLEDMGLNVETVADGEQGLEKLKDKNFELVLLDIRLPGMDGLEMLRQARAQNPGINVMIMTAYSTFDLQMKAIGLGAAGFIQKPFSTEAIRKLVLKMVDQY